MKTICLVLRECTFRKGHTVVSISTEAEKGCYRLLSLYRKSKRDLDPKIHPNYDPSVSGKVNAIQIRKDSNYLEL